MTISETKPKSFAPDPHARMDKALENIRRAAHALDVSQPKTVLPKRKDRIRTYLPTYLTITETEDSKEVKSW